MTRHLCVDRMHQHAFHVRRGLNRGLPGDLITSWGKSKNLVPSADSGHLGHQPASWPRLVEQKLLALMTVCTAGGCSLTELLGQVFARELSVKSAGAKEHPSFTHLFQPNPTAIADMPEPWKWAKVIGNPGFFQAWPF